MRSLSLVLAVGCGGLTAPAADVDASTDASAATLFPAADAAPECVVGQCVASPTCCGPIITGRRYHEAEKCVEGTPTVLACLRKPHPTPAACSYNGGANCYQRVEDGGVVRYLTPSIWTPEQLPGFEECDEPSGPGVGTCP
jgi:hypothetical protein